MCIDSQLPTPKWTALILPDEILCEEQSPASPTPTEDGGAAEPGSVLELDEMISEESSEDQSKKTSADSSPRIANAPALPTHPGCRGGHQMIIDSANQVSFIKD